MAETDDTFISRKEARERGLKRYFTGNPCKHGHIAQRQTTNGVCITCFAGISKRYRDLWPDRKRAQVKSYQSRNQNWKRKKDRESYLRHRDSRQAKNAVWLSNNRDRMAAYKKRWAEENLDKVRSSRRNRKARLRNNGGSHSADDVALLLRLQRHKCAFCKKNVVHSYHVDHIMPLALGGSNDRKNLQILCPTCNMKKSKKDPIMHAKSIGMLV